MAQITVNVADAKQPLIEDAFVALYANPDNLTPAQLVKLHIKNFLRGVLLQHQRQLAIVQVDANLANSGDI